MIITNDNKLQMFHGVFFFIGWLLDPYATSIHERAVVALLFWTTSPSYVGEAAKLRKKITYPNIHPSLRPVPHNPSMPEPLPPKDVLASLADEVVLDEDSNLAPSDSLGFEYELEEKLKPIPFSLEQLNDLIRNLALSKQKAELLASRLQENNLLQKDVLVSHYRNRNTDLSTVFKVDGQLCYCYDIANLFEKQGEDHIASECRFFLDSSKKSLKAVFPQ